MANTLTIEHLPITATTDLDLPVLQAQQAETIPKADCWVKWGRANQNNSVRNPQAWYFYSSDIKLESVVRQPSRVSETGAKYVVEPNLGTLETDLLPVALAGLMQKRSVSRTWQADGLKVFIDLAVKGLTRELVFNGVPSEHCLYATRINRSRVGKGGRLAGVGDLMADYELAKSHCSNPDDLRFVVYGGNLQYQTFCNAQGWLWLPPTNNRRLSID